METIEKRLLSSANGEHRCNPDEQKSLLGTYAERVVLTILSEDAKNECILQHFSEILSRLTASYDAIHVKISPALSNHLQMSYMKISKEQNIPVSIVAELNAKTPFGIVIFSDQVVNLENTDIHSIFPDLCQPPKAKEIQKKSLWKRLFGE